MNTKYIKPIIFAVLFLTFILFLPLSSFANGGDQRVVEGKYLINLSRSPFTPIVGEKTAMLASFVDIKEDEVIQDDLVVHVRIAKLRGSDRRREFLYDEKNVKVKRGILEFVYTFQEAGLHEVFFDFMFASHPEKIYSVPDFLLDIQKTSSQETPSLTLYLGVAMGGIVGFVGGWFIKKKYMNTSVEI